MSYTLGTDFQCTGSICYGLGAKDAAFRQLQAQVNAVLSATAAGPLIAVDGKIGSGTVQAILILARVGPFGASAPFQKVKASAKPTTVAALVPELNAAIAQAVGGTSAPTGAGRAVAQAASAAAQVRATAPPAPGAPVAAGSPITGMATSQGGPVTTAPPAKKSTVFWWAAGLVGLAVAGFLLVHVAHKPKGHEEPALPPE
jgi:hypothetical protein